MFNPTGYPTTILLSGHSLHRRFPGMRAISHITASVVVSAGTYAVFGPEPAAGLLLTGGFMDVDHIGLYTGAGLPMRPSALITSIFRSEGQIERAHSFSRGVPARWYFPLMHCIEFIILLLLCGLLIPSAFLKGAAAGVAMHLLMDIRSYPCGLPFFSMTWRFMHRRDVLLAWGDHRSGSGLWIGGHNT